MYILQSLTCLLSTGALLAWIGYRLIRFSVVLGKADSAGKIRWLISALSWISVSALTYWLGAKNYFVLGGAAAIVALVRFHPNWGTGLVLIIVGLPSAISGFVNSLFWPSHSVTQVLLLDSSISVIFSGSLATGYGFFLCGIVSIIWGLVVGEGFPKTKSLRNGAPFTTESETPEHVILLSSSRT